MPQATPPTPGPAPPPTKTLRERLLHSLPPYSGPYNVGFLEIELPAREPRHFSHIKRNNEYALKLDTVLFAVYYPCDLEQQRRKENKGESQDRGAESRQSCWESSQRCRSLTRTNGQLSRPPWLPRPRGSTCKGYAKFFHVPHLPVTAYVALTSMFTKLPAYRNAKLSGRWPPPTSDNSNQTSPRRRRKDETTTTPTDGTEPNNSKPRFPVVIFSHGLGGSRTMYSSICGELASFGLVVVAMEHRDGSGARTFVNSEKIGGQSDLDSQGLDRTAGPPENEMRAPTRRDGARTKPYYMVDYLFPKGNAQDTSPNNTRGVDRELRGAQIEMRLAEVEEAFYVLSLIDSGKGDQVHQLNLRHGGNVGSSSIGLEGIDWRDWRGRLDLAEVTMMGHSFGGATAVQALRLSERFTWIKQGILLDPWGPATPERTDHTSVQKPVLSIGSEAFMHWTENFDRVEQICDEARAAGTLCWMTTIRGSTHLSQTDFAVLYPNWMSLLMKTIVNPKRAMYLTVHSALEFLKVTLPPHQTGFTAAWADERLLTRADSETKVLSDHRPDDKWVAARLKIPNEFSLRLRSRLWWKNKDAAVPLDASGRPMRGLMNWGVGNEIWCHQSPDCDSVDRYRRQNGWVPDMNGRQCAIV
ncbi:hypothetical protein MFIFM68171_01056 [Madurella fahalii]|uniref:1-alkyl-2-acetylglycerophosphocholine esterase n=1 Tax=Madurella fahalii TaxID=1157608 RepID=A0ABQ0FZA4_9PEZI